MDIKNQFGLGTRLSDSCLSPLIMRYIPDTVLSFWITDYMDNTIVS